MYSVALVLQKIAYYVHIPFIMDVTKMGAKQTGSFTLTL